MKKHGNGAKPTPVASAIGGGVDAGGSQLQLDVSWRSAFIHLAVPAATPAVFARRLPRWSDP